MHFPFDLPLPPKGIVQQREYSEYFRWVSDIPLKSKTNAQDKPESYGGFLKWWYPTTMELPTKNDHFGVFWGYHHLRKYPYPSDVLTLHVHYIKPQFRERLETEGWRPSKIRHDSIALVVNVWRIYSVHQNVSKERRGVLHMIMLTCLNQVHVCFNCSFLLKWSNRCCWTTCCRCLPRAQKQWCTYLSNISCFHLLHQEIIPKKVHAFSTFIKWPQFLSGLQEFWLRFNYIYCI